MRVSGLDHLFFRPRELARSHAFYRDVLGLSCDVVGPPNAPACVVVRLGGGPTLTLGASGDAHGEWPAGFALSLQVEDPDVFAKECASRGLELTRAPHETHWGTRRFSARDPDGLELHFERPVER